MSRTADAAVGRGPMTDDSKAATMILSTMAWGRTQEVRCPICGSRTKANGTEHTPEQGYGSTHHCTWERCLSQTTLFRNGVTETLVIRELPTYTGLRQLLWRAYLRVRLWFEEV